MHYAKNKIMPVRASVCQNITEILMKDADLNVRLTQTVMLTKRAWQINVKIRVQELVAVILNVKL